MNAELAAEVDPGVHRLMINGLVDTPLVFTMQDLLRFPRENRVYFLECAANSGMGDTLIEVRDALGFGLPYGETDVDESYRSADLVARIGVDGDLRRIEFPYIAAIERLELRNAPPALPG